jgi:hypothetical protein
MKRKFLAGLIALAGVSSIFFSCGGSSGNGPLGTDTVITTTELSGAGISPYNTATTGAVVPTENLTLTLDTIIASGTVELAAGTVNKGSNSGAWDAGDTQLVTITLTAATGYTFTGTNITAADVVTAALGANLTSNLQSDETISSNTGNTLVVTVTYEEP